MPLTNAERQARHQQKVKVRLTMAALVEQFRQMVRDQIAEVGGDPDCPDALADHVGQLLRTPEGAEMILPFLAQAVGISDLPRRVGAGDGKAGLVV